MISIVIIFLIVEGLPLPETYILGAMSAILSVAVWLAIRSIAKADKEIESLKKANEKEIERREADKKEYLAVILRIDDNMDRIKETAVSNAADINEKLSTLALKISNDLHELALKLAAVTNFNDKFTK